MKRSDVPQRHVKQRMSSIRDQDSRVTANMKQNSSSVTESIQRGRAALAEAEDHIKMFEEYLQSSVGYADDRNGNGNDDTMVLDMGDGDGDWNDHETMHVELCSLDELLDPVDPISNLGELHGSTHLVDQLMRHGEERLKRDEMISSTRRQGNATFGGYNSRRLLQSGEPKVKLKAKTAFDPNNLSAARRAAIKEAKMADQTLVTELERHESMQFKALPLPGGGEVKNDPYALTKAARGKMNRSRESYIDDGTVNSVHDTTRLDASFLLGDEASVAISPREESGNEINKRKRCKIRNEIYNAATSLVVLDFNDEIAANGSSSDEQDLIGLHQQIARLQAELKIKRLQCIDTIYALEDETQCETIEDVGITGLERDFDNMGEDSLSLVDTSTLLATPANEATNTSVLITNDTDGKMSMYTRHKMWLENLERKRKEAKERDDKDTVKKVTGKPDLELAKVSWSKAKEEHDGLMKSAKERQQMIQSEKEERDRQRQLIQMEESENIRTLAKEKSKSAKRGIDRNLQAEYADKLSRPTNGILIKVERAVNEGLPDEREDREGAKITTTEVVDDKEKTNTASFANMDDKEFAKMIKNMQARATKGGKKKSGSNKGEARIDTMVEDKVYKKDTTMHRNEGMKCSPYKSRK